MMMKMHHHHLELDGRSGGLINARLQPRAHPSTEEVEGFHTSPYMPWSAEYSAHTSPAAAEVVFCDAKNEGRLLCNFGWEISSFELRFPPPHCGSPLRASCKLALEPRKSESSAFTGLPICYQRPNIRRPVKGYRKLIEKWSP